jgi:hypothetical protein
MLLSVLSFSALLVSTARAAGQCEQLFASSGTVVNQICMWVPGGVIEIPMMVLGDTHNPAHFQYLEAWDHAHPSIIPIASGVQWGRVKLQPVAFNATANCVVHLTDNVIASHSARNWTSAGPDSEGFMNVLLNGEMMLLGPNPVQSVSCVLERLVGPVCEATLALLQQRLAIGLPPKKMHLDPKTVCF